MHNVRQFHFLVCTFVLESSFAQSHHCCLHKKPLAPMHFSIHIEDSQRPYALQLCRQFSPEHTEPEPENGRYKHQHSLLKIMSKKSLGSVASVNKNWYFETNESHISNSFEPPPVDKKKNLSGIGKAIRFPSSGPKPKPHDR